MNGKLKWTAKDTIAKAANLLIVAQMVKNGRDPTVASGTGQILEAALKGISFKKGDPSPYQRLQGTMQKCVSQALSDAGRSFTDECETELVTGLFSIPYAQKYVRAEDGAHPGLATTYNNLSGDDFKMEAIL